MTRRRGAAFRQQDRGQAPPTMRGCVIAVWAFLALAAWSACGSSTPPEELYREAEGLRLKYEKASSERALGRFEAAALEWSRCGDLRGTVLSACSTALGRHVSGEGLVGVVRGFMYAGAKRVVASLWKVDDEATGELMRRFYAGMFRDGLSHAAALRQAQLELRQQRRWQAPYYWAAFTLQGEWQR